MALKLIWFLLKVNPLHQNSVNSLVLRFRKLIRKYQNLKNLHQLSQKQKIKFTSAKPCHRKWNWKNNQMFSDKKAVDPHRIPANILKEYKRIFSIPLALIINISFKTGIFPELCKLVQTIDLNRLLKL